MKILRFVQGVLFFFTASSVLIKNVACSAWALASLTMTIPQLEKHCNHRITEFARNYSWNAQMYIIALEHKVKSHISNFLLTHPEALHGDILDESAAIQLSEETNDLISLDLAVIKKKFSPKSEHRNSCSTQSLLSNQPTHQPRNIWIAATKPSAATRNSPASGFTAQLTTKKEFLDFINTLMIDHLITPHQHKHFIVAIQNIPEHFLPFLRKELFAMLEQNFYDLAFPVKHHRKIAAACHPVSVFRNSIRFYRNFYNKKSSLFSDDSWPDLKHIVGTTKADNVTYATSYFYTALASEDFTYNNQIPPSSVRGCFSEKSLAIPADHPFAIRNYTNKCFAAWVVEQLTKYQFLSTRQADRLRSRIKNFPSRRTYRMAVCEAFIGAARFCASLINHTETLDSLETDLLDAVLVHFNNKLIFKECDGFQWQQSIKNASGNIAKLTALESQLYDLLAAIPDIAA